jgi:integration host factor subunit alpha
MNNNISKKVIINNLSNKTGFSNNFSKKLINDFILVLITHIKKKKLNLKNVGTFKLIEKKERLGRNPKTKEQFIICSRKSVSFTASKNLLLVLNQNK